MGAVREKGRESGVLPLDRERRATIFHRNAHRPASAGRLYLVQEFHEGKCGTFQF